MVPVYRIPTSSSTIPGILWGCVLCLGNKAKLPFFFSYPPQTQGEIRCQNKGKTTATTQYDPEEKDGPGKKKKGT